MNYFGLRSAARAIRSRLSVRSTDDLIAAADHYRDQRKWAKATRTYCKVLRRNPGLQAIWVQYGHAMGESGDQIGRETAYLTAWALGPDADTALHLGHVTKVLGRHVEAAEWYERALALDRALDEAARELRALSAGAVPDVHDEPPLLRSHPLVLDVTDLVKAGISGGPIDPDQVWLMEVFLAACPEGLLAYLEGNGQFAVLPREKASRLAEVCGGATAHWLPPENASPLPAKAILFLPEAAWHADYDLTLLLSPLRASHDVRFIAFGSITAWVQRRALYDVDIVVPVQPGSDYHWSPSRMRCPPILPFSPATPLKRSRPMDSAGSQPHGAGVTVLLPRDCEARTRLLETIKALSFCVPVTAVAPLFSTAHLTRLKVQLGERCTLLSSTASATAAVLTHTRLLVIVTANSGEALWISRALQMGIPVVGGCDGTLYKRWTHALSGYADLEHVQTVDTLMSLKHLPRRTPFGDAVRLYANAFSELLEQIHLSQRNLKNSCGVEDGVYYQFGTDASDDWDSRVGRADPFILRGQCQRFVNSTTFAPAEVQLGLNLPDTACSDYVCRVLVYNPNKTPVVCRLCASHGDPPGTGDTVIPGGSACWLLATILHTRQPVLVNISAATPRDNGSQLCPLELVGFFVYPATEDRHWFEFMDRAQRGLYPIVRQFMRRTRLARSEPVPPV